MTVKNIYKINTTHWSHKIGTIGDVAENIADIIQCYETIIMTQKGSVILNPNLGWNIRKFHSKPINEVAPVMKNELLKELNYQEPRATANKIMLITDKTAKGYLGIKVKFTYQNQQQMSEVNIKW